MINIEYEHVYKIQNNKILESTINTIVVYVQVEVYFLEVKP